jgi:hypothetical protein
MIKVNGIRIKASNRITPRLCHEKTPFKNNAVPACVKLEWCIGGNTGNGDI